jgi:hypothetical protein
MEKREKAADGRLFPWSRCYSLLFDSLHAGMELEKFFVDVLIAAVDVIEA